MVWIQRSRLDEEKSIEQDKPMEDKLPSTKVSLKSDPTGGNQSNEIKEVHTEEVESGRTDTQVKSDTAANGREEIKQNTGITISARNSYYKYSDHLSGPSYLADPRAASGHIAYSGSVSLRSDSSTTSTRSFAFPILQSEWNYSPAKMDKPDRRYIGKNRRLKSVFFCCKF